MPKDYERGSGNIFIDAGFPPAEAARLLIRAELMSQVRAVIKERGLTQARAAKLLGVTQPRISDLKCGHIGRFSIDTLVDMLSLLGVTVTVKTRRVRAA